MKVMLIAGSAMLLGGYFQLPSAPPMKVGLWEATSTSHMTMPGMPANMPPRTSKVQTCVAADSWAKTIGQPQGQDCSKTSESFSGKTYSADVSCKSGAKGHVEMTWDGPDSGHGTMHLDMNMNGHAGSVDMTMSSHFVSSNCGAVQPGKAVPVQ
jgi:Protein of unknown function (DUF3617)